MRDYFYVYKTTNMVNRMFYVGCHKTRKLNDGYLGSGVRLKRAVKKYGEENFKREILSQHGSLEEMFEAEAEIVTADFVARKDTYNLTEGGQTPGLEILSLAGKKGSAVNKKNGTGIFSKNVQDMVKVRSNSVEHVEFMKSLQPKATKASRSKVAQRRRIDSVQKSGKQRGEFNSQHNTTMITDGSTNRRISKSLPIPNGWQQGITLSAETKEKTKDRMWITDGKNSTLVKKSSVIPEGWRKGLTKKNNKMK